MSTRIVGPAQTARRPRAALGAVLTVVALMIAGYAGAPSASALPAHARPATASPDTGSASVIGTVTIEVEHAHSPAGTVVTLTETPESGNAETRTTMADTRGGFRFDGLAGGAGWTYSVAATYLSTTYESDPVQVEAGLTVNVPLRLFAPTTSSTLVSQTVWDVWIDKTATGIAVQQDVSLTNTGALAYTGSRKVPDAPAGLDLAAFTLPITDQADDLETVGRFQTCCSYVKGTTWTHTRPISPGTSTGTLRYETPSVPSLAFPVTLPTGAFRLLVADGLTITSSQLSRTGTSDDRGVTYTVYSAPGALKPNETIAVALSGAPVDEPGPSWWTVAVVAVLLVAALAVIAVTAGRRTSPAGASATSRPATTTVAALQEEEPAAAAPTATSAAPAARPTTGSVRRTRADELTDELATLDLAWENGTITDEGAYRRIRGSLVAQLVAEVGDGS